MLRCKSCDGAVHDFDMLCIRCFNIAADTFNELLSHKAPPDAKKLEKRYNVKSIEAIIAEMAVDVGESAEQEEGLLDSTDAGFDDAELPFVFEDTEW